MRPMGQARMYVLATRGTEEEEFARRRTRHLASKGVRVRETEADVVTDGDDETPAAVDATGEGPAASGRRVTAEGGGDDDGDGPSGADTEPTADETDGD